MATSENRLTSTGGGGVGSGDVIAGRYEVQAVLGEGGLGRLYRVRATSGQVLALRLTVAKGSATVANLKDALALQARVKHPGLCRVRDCGEHAGHAWYAMDFVDGESLERRIGRAGEMAPDEAAGLICSVAEIVAAIHDAGLVHQDIKQGNVFVSRDHETKLAELSVVVALARAAGVPAAKLSTPSTRATEQSSGGPPDPRSDVYALGAVLYYALTAKRAFPTGRQFVALADRLGAEPPPVKDLPRKLRPIVARALAIRVEDRFQSARELAAALAKLRAVA